MKHIASIFLEKIVTVREVIVKKIYCEPYLGRNCDIGVPHKFQDRLFFYSGIILELTEDSLILQMKDGIKVFDYRDIIEISLHKGD